VSVRTRLVMSFVAVIAVLMVPSLLAVSQLARLRRLAVEGRAGQAVATESLGRIQSTMADLNRLERSLIATSDTALSQSALAASDSMASAYARFAKSPYADVGAGLAPIVSDVAARTRDIGRQMGAGRVEDATLSFDSMMSSFGRADHELAVTADSIDTLGRRDRARAQTISHSARLQMLIGIVVALLLTMILAALTTRALTTPLRQLSRATARVADGVFDVPPALPYERRDEIGELSSSFRTMTRRLAELDRTKSEFLGMVSHELKTPVNVISAYAELMEEELDGYEGTLHKLQLGMRQQADVLTRLVNRLMDISRLEAGTYRLSPEPVRVADLLSGVDHTFRRLAEEMNVKLTVKKAEGTPESVVLDVDIIRDEVLGNLLLNALRYAPEGGWAELSAEGDAHGVVFTVTDSGPGIPEEHRAHIFRKHYVADRTRAVGSGLGLAIAKEMVELHGGLIWLEPSEAGVGARFKVALPAVLAPIPGVPDGALVASTAHELAHADA
jgi:signal transduction histidine kinase